MSEQRGSLYMQKFLLDVDSHTLNYVEHGGRYSLWDFLEMNFPNFTRSFMQETPSIILLGQIPSRIEHTIVRKDSFEKE